MRVLTGIAFITIGFIFWNCSQTKIAEESAPPPDPKDLMSEFKVDEEMAQDFEIPEQAQKEEDKETIGTSKITTIDKAPVVLAKGKKQKKMVTPAIQLIPPEDKGKENHEKKIGLSLSPIKEVCCSLPEKYPVDYNPLYVDYDKESINVWKQLKPQIYIGEIFTEGRTN